MSIYILKRLFQGILVLWGVYTITFILFFLVPGDPARMMMGQRVDVKLQEQMKKNWGFPDSSELKKANVIGKILIYSDFYTRIGVNMISFDFGRSLINDEEVFPIIMKRFKATFILSLASLIIAILIGITMGVYSALYKDKWIDNTLRVSSLALISVPSFLVAIFLQWIFGQLTHIFPVAGYLNGPKGMLHLIMPMMCLTIGPYAGILRITRASMIEVLNQDYILTTWAKGLPKGHVIIEHALKNGLIPVVTTIGGSLAAMLSGTYLIEYIFAWPGLGLLAIDAVFAQDLFTILGTVLFSASIFVIVNLLVDLSYAWLDPRVRLR